MSAPSFSSFPPVFDSFPDLDTGSNSSSRPQSVHPSESANHDRRKEKKRASDKDKKEDEDKERRYERRAHEKKREKKSDGHSKKVHSAKYHSKRRSPIFAEDLGPEAVKSGALEGYNHYYYVDRKGDELNVKYGSLHAGDVPKYWHVARGKQVLGLSPQLAILSRGSKGVEIGEGGRHGKAPQLTDSRARKMLSSGHTRRLSATSRTALKYEEIDGFIRIPSRKGKEKDQEYRSIVFEDHADSDSDTTQSESEFSDDESDLSPLSAREEALRDLERRLEEDPTSESTWLSLLHHSIGGIDVSSKNAERSRAENAVSVLEKALSQHPANRRSALLRLKYLKAGELTWDKARAEEEWNKALEEVATADIYVEWLDWRIRITPDFNAVVEHAIKATHLVAGIGLDETADFAMLRIFWRITTFLKQAGYVERGFALFQAQTELSFNMPINERKASFDKQLDSLEEFWESEAPRAGEVGSKGWKSWKMTKEMNTGSKPRQVGKCNSQNPYTVWHFQETQLDSFNIFPIRMLGHEEEDQSEENAIEGYDDPYASVLFSDIRPFLVDLHTAKGRDMLRLIWLSYLGLHIPGLSSALSSGDLCSDDRWADTYFLQPFFIHSLFPDSPRAGLITADSQIGVIIGREKTYTKIFGTIKSWNLDVVEPLDGLSVDGAYRMWSRGCLDAADSEITEVMRRILNGISHDESCLPWKMFELAFETLSHQIDSALKRSQTMLSENSSSAELLASHAYLERIRRKYDKARKVYRVGIQSLAQSNDPSVVCLWWGSAELEWLLSKIEAALEVVLTAAGQSNARSGLNILRARRRLDELCQESVTKTWTFRLKWMKLRILLELLAGTLDTAVEVSQTLLALEVTGSLQHESLTVASLIMVYHHTVTLRNPAPPNILRNLVRPALDIYQSNSIVIGIFLECEKGESVWGRVRTLTNESGPGIQEKSVARRLIDVWIARWEEGRWLTEVERVRAGLEAAVTSDRTKGSPIIWKVYVKFEIAAGNVKRAKAVLFRALKECPLVKELYLLAFEQDLRDTYTRRELMDLSDTMAERGIRLRHTLGDVLEMHRQESVSGSDDSEEEEEDELEYESRETKRLMPY